MTFSKKRILENAEKTQFFGGGQNFLKFFLKNA